MLKITAMVLDKDPDYWEYCKASIENIVDEIVHYDGDLDDFAEMRNSCLRRIDSDWVLVLDGDEVLANADGSLVRREQLEELVKIADEKGYSGFHIFTVHFLYNYHMIDGQNNGQHMSISRFYRRKDIVKYRGKIHEIPEFKFGQNIKTTDKFWIWHFGHCKGMEQIRRKYKRTLNIDGNPFKPPNFDGDVDGYCKTHDLFLMTRPIIFYYGPMPTVMRLW